MKLVLKEGGVVGVGQGEPAVDRLRVARRFRNLVEGVRGVEEVETVVVPFEVVLEHARVPPPALPETLPGAGIRRPEVAVQDRQQQTVQGSRRLRDLALQLA